MVFEGSFATNVTAYFGSTALLSCKVRNNQEDNPVRVYSKLLGRNCEGISESHQPD